MLVVKMPGRPPGRARDVPRPAGLGNDGGARATSDMPPRGGACADRLCTLEPAAVTRHRNRCGRHESRCLLVIIGGVITSPVRQCLSAGSLEATEETFGWPIPASRAMAAS